MTARRLADALNAVGWDGLEVPNLTAAYDLSERYIGRARDQLRSVLDVAEYKLDIATFGSLARREMTTESDLDWLVIVHDIDDRPGAVQHALEAADALRTIVGDDGKHIRQPGATGVFGGMVSAVSLAEVIGLEGDTNHSHTRRVLLIEESASLFREDLHRKLLTAVFRRYLEVHLPDKAGVPRFLLNDLVRYWRTVAIDYQAKSPAHSMYSLRYLKLILTRKFSFAASILPLMMMALSETERNGDELAEVLYETFSAAPLIRFLDASATLVHVNSAISEALRGIVEVVEEFNGLMASAEWRSEIDEGSRLANAREQPQFAHARDLGRRLQRNLEDVFFAEPLLPLTRKYLVF